MPARPMPLIGIPTCMRTINERVFHGVSERYPNAVIDATGCLPVLIPAVGSKVDMCVLLDRLDGLLLTGSPSNVEPSHYGGAPSQEGTLHDPAPDATTLPLIREAIRRDLPILAICRGAQVLNIARGGTLHQHIPELADSRNHRQKDPGEEPTHEVQLDPGSKLAEVLGTNLVDVNSFHHQAVASLGDGLRAVAWADDGLVEGIEDPDRRFVIGVQCHAETLAHRPEGALLFRRFVESTEPAGPARQPAGESSPA